MSLGSTSRPDFSATLRYRIRDPVRFCNWWKCTSWSWTAEYAFTGMLTSPNVMVPDQTGRATGRAYPRATWPEPSPRWVGRRTDRVSVQAEEVAIVKTAPLNTITEGVSDAWSTGTE